MILLGLTGGIGMGKSTAADLLERLGVPSIDTDLIARAVVEPGQPALEAVRACFGPEVISPDGRLNRERMAREVFSNPDARKRLESILHPRIREVWLARVERWREEGVPVGAVVIPLLFETGASDQVNATICVACSGSSQRARLQTRGWTEDQIRQRIESQWPAEEKMLRSDFVAWNEGELGVLTEQLQRILDCVLKPK
jgi:dephospho-CoA kinase